MKDNSEDSKNNMKQRLLSFVIGAVGVWLIFLLWNFSEAGMMKKILDTVGYEPEKVYVDFPESKIFAEKIFYEEKIDSNMSTGGPIYREEVAFERFQKLASGEVYALSRHKVINQKLKITLTGSAVDGVMRYYTVVQKKIDIPKGKRFVDLRYVDGRLEISQQIHFGIASWRLVVERAIYFVVIAVLLVWIFLQSWDIKNAAKIEFDLRKQLHSEVDKRTADLDELVKVKKQLDEIEKQKLDEGGAGD